MAIVLTLFLYNLRTAFISLTAIPRTLRGHGQPVNDAVLRYLWPMGWEHNLTGDHVWRSGAKVAAGKVQAVATAANGLACFIFRFLRRPHVHVVARSFGHV